MLMTISLKYTQKMRGLMELLFSNRKRKLPAPPLRPQNYDSELRS